MIVEFESVGGRHVVEVKCQSIMITMYYRKTSLGFEVFQNQEDMPPHLISGEQRGTLEIKIDVEGMFGGPLVSFYDEKGLILNLKRRSSASLAVHLPEGGVTARDGIGDWTKVITLSKDEIWGG